MYQARLITTRDEMPAVSLRNLLQLFRCIVRKGYPAFEGRRDNPIGQEEVERWSYSPPRVLHHPRNLYQARQRCIGEGAQGQTQAQARSTASHISTRCVTPNTSHRGGRRRRQADLQRQANRGAHKSQSAKPERSFSSRVRTTSYTQVSSSRGRTSTELGSRCRDQA